MPKKKTSRTVAKNDHEGMSDEDARGGTSPRGIWSGSISFGLLQIPVTLFPAEDRKEQVHFHMLDKKDLSRIRFQRVNATTGKVVDWKDIVRGYETQKDEFVVVSDDELENANVKATQTIDIQDFVLEEQIDRVFFETPYYLVPQKRAGKAYMLLRDALKKKGACAMATFVMRKREHLAAIMATDDYLLLEVMRFGHELRDVEKLPFPSIPEQKVSPKELAMAEQLISGMMTDFDGSKYVDRYAKDVRKLVQEKAKTGAVTAHHAETRGEMATDVVDLLELLKQSVSKKAPAKARHPAARHGRKRGHEAA